MSEELFSLLQRSSLASCSAIVVLGILGCGETEPSLRPAAVAVPPHEHLTGDDCLAFVNSLTQAAESMDLEALSWMIDYDAIIDRATTPSLGSEEFNEFFRLRTFRDLAGATGVPTAIVTLMKEGGEFRCLQIYTDGGSQRAVFRLLVQGRPSLDYFEFELAPHSNERSLITDYWFARTGEMVSESVRRRYRMEATVMSKVLAREELTETDLQLIRAIGKIGEMALSLMAGDAQRALDIYDELPTAFQREKFVLLNRLDAATQLGGTAYVEAMEAIASTLVNDPCLDFLLVDHYAHRRQFDKMRTAIDRIDKRVGGDPYQDARRALSYFLEKKYELARDFAQKALDVEDTLHLPHRIVLLVALEEKDFDEVCRLLPNMLGKGIVTLSDLETGTAYAEFRVSSQYQEWLRQTDAERPLPK